MVIRSHPQHTLYDGCLLEPAGVKIEDNKMMVNICELCYGDLTKNDQCPPRYSLANNLWIGRIPWELRSLSLPEQLLVSLIYPRVYIFKLFPKKRGCYSLDQLQSGMRGNVVSYEQDIQGIESMIEGCLMPRPVRILASLLSITFVGVGRLPRNWLKTTFRVRREAVRMALNWLHCHNTKYYGDIKMDEGRLQDLPNDDVPEEILSIVRQSSNVKVADEEMEGHIDELDVSLGKLYYFILFYFIFILYWKAGLNDNEYNTNTEEIHGDFIDAQGIFNILFIVSYKIY
jgi:hypothetical protein